MSYVLSLIAIKSTLTLETLCRDFPCVVGGHVYSPKAFLPQVPTGAYIAMQSADMCLKMAMVISLGLL